MCALTVVYRSDEQSVCLCVCVCVCVCVWVGVCLVAGQWYSTVWQDPPSRGAHSPQRCPEPRPEARQPPFLSPFPHHNSPPPKKFPRTLPSPFISISSPSWKCEAYPWGVEWGCYGVRGVWHLYNWHLPSK